MSNIATLDMSKAIEKVQDTASGTIIDQHKFILAKSNGTTSDTLG